MDKVKVLYIMGAGRSGTTILQNILGGIDGFTAVGEINVIWKHHLIDNKRCGCGLPFNECVVWNKVLDQAFGGFNQVDVQEMLRLRSRIRMRHLPLMVLPGSKERLRKRIGQLQTSLEKLYHAIQSVTNSSVIVDSSKSADYGFLLSTLPMIDLYIVHLIRDSRGTAYSRQRKKLEREHLGKNSTELAYMAQFHPWLSSVEWMLSNGLPGLFWKASSRRYVRMRYEDFVQNPQASVEQILAQVGEKPTRLPFVGKDEVELTVSHTTTGNPIRFNTGTVKLHMDDEWKTRMKRFDKLFVTALTWPLLLKLGYLRPK